MAMSVSSGGKGRGRRTYRPMSEINVTPFVDVMLVLLVIFMITAPLLTVAVPVNLAKTKGATIGKPDKPLIVSIKAGGQVYLQDTEMDGKTLIARLKAITASRPGTTVYVRGDKAVPYGQVLAVMGQISAAGFTKVALIAEQDTTKGPAADKPGPKKQ
jgi:biopolymer transport protein TolR